MASSYYIDYRSFTQGRLLWDHWVDSVSIQVSGVESSTFSVLLHCANHWAMMTVTDTKSVWDDIQLGFILWKYIWFKADVSSIE